MKKMQFALWTVCLLLAGCTAAQTCQNPGKITLAANGKSEYAIVLPDKCAPGTEPHLLNTAKFLAEQLKEGTGAGLPVVRESRLGAKRKAIYLGNTQYARRQGIDFTKFDLWHSLIQESNGNVILGGLDRSAFKPEPKSEFYYVLGTTRAVTLFLRDFAGVRFLLPDSKSGVHVPKRKILTIPAGYKSVDKPRFFYQRTRPVDLFYSVANGYFHSTTSKLYGGHSYYYSVPKAKYGKTHPEYFILTGGGRSSGGGHLCISNPEVQQLMIDEMTKIFDMGYEMVELSQSDGYTPCGCEKCQKMFGGVEPGERLWLYHRMLAEKMAKIRPGKTVLIICYGPTATPPKTFREFPENTAIELCSLNPAWKNYKVPQGFTSYLYIWGAYNITGLSPKRSAAWLDKQYQQLLDNDVRAIYQCGFGELWGLEGPAYYAWGQLTQGRVKSAAPAIVEFVDAAYGEAAVPMRKFFLTLDEQLNGAANNGVYPSWGVRQTSRTAIPGSFSPEFFTVMGGYLKSAEQIARDPKVKTRLALVRQEYDLFECTTKALTYYNTYRFAPTHSNFDQLAAACEKRTALIDKLFYPKGTAKRPRGWKNLPVFLGLRRPTVQTNGSLRGLVGAPFNWNFKMLKAKNILPCTGNPRTTVQKTSVAPSGFDFEKGAWAKAPWLELNEIQLAEPSAQTRVKVLYDKNNLYVGFDTERKIVREYRSAGRDGACWAMDDFEVMLDPDGDRSHHYQFICNTVENSCFDARWGFSTDPLDPNINKADSLWNGKWSYTFNVTPKRRQAVVTIPFATLGVKTPSKGTLWSANFAAGIFHPGVKNPEELLWSPNPEARTFHDRDKFGELLFQ